MQFFIIYLFLGVLRGPNEPLRLSILFDLLLNGTKKNPNRHSHFCLLRYHKPSLKPMMVDLSIAVVVSSPESQLHTSLRERHKDKDKHLMV